MDNQQTQLPLFPERARTTHPVTSHTRAAGLDKSVKLQGQMLAVLKGVRTYGNRTARHIGMVMYHFSKEIEQSQWPWKCMKRLEDAGFVERKYSEHGLLCTITEAGKKILENLGK